MKECENLDMSTIVTPVDVEALNNLLFESDYNGDESFLGGRLLKWISYWI